MLHELVQHPVLPLKDELGLLEEQLFLSVENSCDLGWGLRESGRSRREVVSDMATLRFKSQSKRTGEG